MGQQAIEIVEHATLSRPAISHHLKVLRDIRIVSSKQKGTQRYYSLSLNQSIALLKQLVEAVETNCD